MNESIDRVLADWLHEGSESGPREGLERALAATRRVGQRPGWSLLERWLPMQLTMAWTRTQRPILAIATLALLILALVAVALYVGSQQRLPPAPFRNGAIVYADSGDLFIVDQLGGAPRTLVAGPERDTDPVFSDQGDRVAFVRDGADKNLIMSSDADGTNVIPLGSAFDLGVSLDWSPDGSALLVSASDHVIDNIGGSIGIRRIDVVRSDASGSRRLDVGDLREPDSASWRPDGRQIAFRGHDESGAGAFLADSDGSNVRKLAIGFVGLAEQTGQFDVPTPGGLAWSPDGKHLAFLNDTAQGRLSIIDIDEAGTVSQLRWLPLEPGSSAAAAPVWSPDGRQIAFLLRIGGPVRVEIATTDGSGHRLVGPEAPVGGTLEYAWSPDGRSLLIQRARTIWSVDVTTGEQTEVRTPLGTWQRLTP